MRVPPAIARIPELQPVLEAQPIYVDVKVATGTVDLPTFVAAMLGYQPGWITALYRLRAVLLRTLGMPQAGIRRGPKMTPETVPMRPGSSAGRFTVRMAEQDRYWVGEASEQHLEAAVGVVVEPLGAWQATLLCAHGGPLPCLGPAGFTGPVNLVFVHLHHLVVKRMAAGGSAHGDDRGLTVGVLLPAVIRSELNDSAPHIPSPKPNHTACERR